MIISGRAARAVALVAFVTATAASSAWAQTLSLGAGTQYASGTSGTSDTPGVAFADLDGDGKLDLIVADCDNGTVRVRLGNGAGTFGSPTDLSLPSGGSAFGIAIGDFNEDGKLDVATADSSLIGYAAVFLGHGDGTFDPVTEFAVGSYPNMVIAADFNGDGHLDLATPDSASNTVTVLLGDGSGGFPTSTSYGTGANPTAVRAGDLNGDQVLDLVVTNFNDSTVSVFLGQGIGGFTALTPFVVDAPSTAGPMDVGILDVDHDGIPDLAIAAYSEDSLFVFSGHDGGDGFGDGTFTSTSTLATGSFPTAVQVADINGDGIQDVIVADFGDSSVSVFPGTGSFTGLGSAQAFLMAPFSGPQALATADINGDGKLDLAVGYGDIDASEIFLNDTCCFVTVTVNGTGTGAVSGTGTLYCPPDCVRAFDSSTSPELDATPDTGSLFTGWSGACTGTGPCVIPSGSDAVVTATFDHLALGPPAFPAGSVGTLFSTIVTSTDGTAPFVFGMQAGSLPPGLALDPDSGGMSGTPTQAGTFAFTLYAQDSFGVYGTRAYSITIAAGATSTLPFPAIATYDDAAQPLTLSATVFNGVAVNGGTVTFTVRDGSSAVIGSPVTSATVSGGHASAGYMLPGGTGAQTLTITAAYSGSADYLASSNTTPLTIATAPSTTAALPATASFSAAAQTVLVSAFVDSANGVVNGGTVTFTLRDGGSAVVGSPVSAPVSGGAASAGYVIPAGSAPQTFTITAVFSGTTNFNGSSDAAHTLVLGPASTTTSATAGSVPYRIAAQTVPLSATVTSAGGTVNTGAVTFTVRTAGAVTVGASVNGAVSNGTANAAYTLPAGTPAQALTITAAYGATTDFAASSGSATLMVGCPAITIGPATPPAIRLGQPFSMTLSASAVTDAVFSIGGTLPAGLTFAGSAISGTPTALGRFDIIATAMSASTGCSASQPYSFRVMRAPLFVAGAGSGASVNIYDGTGTLVRSFTAADPGSSGGIRVAMADLTGDGVDEVITAPGLGAADATVRVFDGYSGSEIREFVAYPYPSPGGIYVAAGDVNGDGVPDIVTGRDGAPPEVRVFDGRSGALIVDFFAYDPSKVGGVRVAVGDVDADGFAEIITGPLAGTPPEVRVFSGDGTLRTAFNAYDPAFFGGVYVAAGDVDGDGRADIVTGAGAGGGPHVKVFSGVDLHVLRSFYAYTPEFGGGVRVAAGDLDLDGHAEVITAAGPGGGPHVRVWDGATGSEVVGFYAFDPTFGGGVFVAAPPAQPRTVIDAPASGSTVGPTFLVGGWVKGAGATIDSGVDTIHVWALPVGSGAPIFLGATPPGVSRPDVAAVFGGVFADAGFNMIAGPLPPGTYDLVVFAHSARSGTFASNAVARIVVP